MYKYGVLRCYCYPAIIIIVVIVVIVVRSDMMTE